MNEVKTKTALFRTFVWKQRYSLIHFSYINPTYQK